jgi:hypothetical protein
MKESAKGKTLYWNHASELELIVFYAIGSNILNLSH